MHKYSIHTHTNTHMYSIVISIDKIHIHYTDIKAFNNVYTLRDIVFNIFIFMILHL